MYERCGEHREALMCRLADASQGLSCGLLPRAGAGAGTPEAGEESRASAAALEHLDEAMRAAGPRAAAQCVREVRWGCGVCAGACET